MPAITAHSHHDIAETEAALRTALAEQGFGVRTEIDIAATFKAKLDIDWPPLKILDACNPHLAHQALETDPNAALVLPCNVVLEATEHGTAVSAADPTTSSPTPLSAHSPTTPPTSCAPRSRPSTATLLSSPDLVPPQC